MTGKFTPEILKTPPITVPLLMVTAAVPEEVMVTDWVDGVFKLTLPKDKLLAPMVSLGAAAPRLME